MEQHDDLSQFKIDSENDTSITKHASVFLYFCQCYEINCEYVACFFSSSHLKVDLTDGVILYQFIPFIILNISSRNFI